MHCETEDDIELLPDSLSSTSEPSCMRAYVLACICVQGQMLPVGVFLEGPPPSKIGALTGPGFSEGLIGEPQEFSYLYPPSRAGMAGVWYHFTVWFLGTFTVHT